MNWSNDEEPIDARVDALVQLALRLLSFSSNDFEAIVKALGEITKATSIDHIPEECFQVLQTALKVPSVPFYTAAEERVIRVSTTLVSEASTRALVC
jgi:hypothetical protein